MSDNQAQDAGDGDEFDPTSVVDTCSLLARDTCDLAKVNTASFGKVIPAEAVQILLDEARKDNPDEDFTRLSEQLWYSVFHRLQGVNPNMNKPAEAYVAIFICRHFLRIKGNKVIQYSYGNAPTQLLQSTSQDSPNGRAKTTLINEFATLKVFADGNNRKLMDWYLNHCKYQLKIDISHTHVPVNTQDVLLMDPATRAQAMLTPVHLWMQKWRDNPSAADGTAIYTPDGGFPAGEPNGYQLPYFGKKLESFLHTLPASKEVSVILKNLDTTWKRDKGKGDFISYTMCVRVLIVFALGGGQEGATRYKDLLYRHVSALYLGTLIP